MKHRKYHRYRRARHELERYRGRRDLVSAFTLIPSRGCRVQVFDCGDCRLMAIKRGSLMRWWVSPRPLAALRDRFLRLTAPTRETRWLKPA